MQVQSCCFANLNLMLFCRSRCRRRRPCLSFLIRICGWVTLGPLHMRPTDGDQFRPGWIWEISARFPRWKKAEDTDWRPRVLGRNSRNKATMTKHKVITFAPIIVLASLIAVSLQLNGMLMMWKIQQGVVKQEDTELIRRTHPSFISVTTTTMLGGPCQIACYAGYFFSQAARGQWARVFEISPFALRKKKQEKTNKQTRTRASPSISPIWLTLLEQEPLDPDISNLFGSDHPLCLSVMGLRQERGERGNW